MRDFDASKDSDVKHFRAALAHYERYRVSGNRETRVIGVYVGWRGDSLSTPRKGPLKFASLAKNLTYWNRKSVAQEVGKGGVTELLLSLKRLAYCGTTKLDARCPGKPEDTAYLIIGHSFGGAIVLSAMNEVLLNTINDAHLAPRGEKMRSLGSLWISNYLI